jgi:hypothetical protein
VLVVIQRRTFFELWKSFRDRPITDRLPAGIGDRLQPGTVIGIMAERAAGMLLDTGPATLRDFDPWSPPAGGGTTKRLRSLWRPPLGPDRPGNEFVFLTYFTALRLTVFIGRRTVSCLTTRERKTVKAG